MVGCRLRECFVVLHTAIPSFSYYKAQAAPSTSAGRLELKPESMRQAIHAVVNLVPRRQATKAVASPEVKLSMVNPRIIS